MELVDVVEGVFLPPKPVHKHIPLRIKLALHRRLQHKERTPALLLRYPLKWHEGPMKRAFEAHIKIVRAAIESVREVALVEFGLA